MSALFLKILNLSIIAGWITLAIVILRPLLKKAPKAITVALWALVAIRLLFPFSIESVISLIPSAETVPPEIIYVEEPAINSGVTYANTIINPVISEKLAPTPEASVNPMQILVSVASVIWVVGMIAMAIYAAVSYLRIRLKVRASIPMGERIRICDEIPSPFILGILRPRIYLPSDLEESQKAHVIAHEEAHLKRKDHWWKPLGFALLTVYWFHPLLWVAYILLCRDIELACDEKVIQNMEPLEKTAYSKALLSCSAPRRMISACPLAFGEVGVKKRIKAILHYKKPAFWFAVIAVVICVICTGCLLTDPLKEEATVDSVTLHQYYSGGNVLYKKTHPDLLCGFFMPSDYYIEKDQLYIKEGAPKIHLGTLSPLKLTKENFDDLFEDEYWKTEDTAQELRESNETAWKVDVTEGAFNHSVFYLLKQKGTSTLLIAYIPKNYNSTGEAIQMDVEWMHRLVPDEEGQSSSYKSFIQKFLNGENDQIHRLYFTYNKKDGPYYSLDLSQNQAGSLSHSSVHPVLNSGVFPSCSFDYTWDGETLTATLGDIVLFTLIPSANGVLYRSGELDIMPSVSSSYVAEMPEDGSFFVLSYVEYKSN